MTVTADPTSPATASKTGKERAFEFWTTSVHYRDFGDSHLDESPHRREIGRLLGPLVSAGRNHVLDLCCGDGNNLPHLPAGCDYTGADCSPVALERLLERDDHKPATKRAIKADVENLPLEDGSVDAIISTFAFEHLSDVPRVLGECDRVLAPGGRLLIIGPDFEFPNSFGPPQHAELLGKRGPLLRYALGRMLDRLGDRLCGRETFQYVEPLELDDATYLPDFDMTHLTDHGQIGRHMAGRGYRVIEHAGTAAKPAGLKGVLHSLGWWGENGDVRLCLEKPVRGVGDSSRFV